MSWTPGFVAAYRVYHHLRKLSAGPNHSPIRFAPDSWYMNYGNREDLLQLVEDRLETDLTLLALQQRFEVQLRVRWDTSFGFPMLVVEPDGET